MPRLGAWRREYYTPGDIAAAVGVSERAVQRRLRRRNPHHRGWWRFSRRQFVEIVSEWSTHCVNLPQ